ncbi:MAG: hypothetical protein U0746_20335 [Gemmataceae bacterium]
MTKLGKALTLLNVALALTFLAWALGLYTNQIFWHTPQTQDGQRVEGLVDQLKKKVDEVGPMREAAERQWYDATVEVNAAEQLRPKLQADYAARLRSLRKGDVTDIKPPVQPLVFKGSELDFKRTGQPGLEIDNKAALSIAGYQKAIRDKFKEMVEAKDELTKVVAETTQLTTQIIGTKENKTEAITDIERGLYERWVDYQKLVLQYKLEQQFLRSPLTTVTLDNAVLKKRQQQLQGRLDELNNASRALGRR